MHTSTAAAGAAGRRATAGRVAAGPERRAGWSLPFVGGWGGNGNSAAQRDKVKQELLERIRPLNRGAAASDEDKAEVDTLATQLEKLNPNPKPLTGGVVDGAWELQYTTSSSILGLNKPPFLRPSGKIFQVLDSQTLTARNIETAPLFNQVSAKLEPVSQNKLAVQFQEFRIFNLIPIKAPPSARGELAITYVDEDLRISRGDKGNLFVLTMADRSRKP